MWLILKTKILIFQSKVNPGQKCLLGKITDHLDPEPRKCWYETCFGTIIPHSILVYDLLAIEIEILFLKLTMVLN